MNDAEKNDRWYVDVRGTVSIMTTSQILQALFSLELKVINRISRNKENWKAICNEPLFEILLQEKLKTLSTETFGETPIVNVADLAQSENDTGGLGIDINTMAGQISNQLQQAQRMQEVSLSITNIRRVLTEISVNKKVVHDSVTSDSLERETLHPEDRDVFKGGKGFSKESKTKLVTTGRILFYGMSLVLMLVFGGMELVERVLGNATEKKKVQVAVESRNKRITAYSSTVGNFNGLVSEQPAKSTDPTAAPDDTDQFASQFNLAVDHIQRQDFAGAEPILLDTFKYPKHDRAPSILALFEVALRLDQKEGLQNTETRWPRVTQVSTMLDRINESGHPFEAELSLIRISSSILLGKDWVGPSKFFIEQFPTESVREGAEKNLNYGRFFWANMCRWLVDSMESQRADAFLNAVLGSCLLRSDQPLRAKPFIDYAQKRAPGELSIEYLAGYMFLVSGNLGEAKKILNKETNIPTVLIKKSREWLCTHHPTDESCIEREPSALLKSEPETRAPPVKTAPLKRKKPGRR